MPLVTGSKNEQTSSDGFLMNVQPTTASVDNMHVPLLPASKRWPPKVVRSALACSAPIAEATIRCSSGRPGYTVARAWCAPEPYNLSAPRSRLTAKHSTRPFSSFVVSLQVHDPLAQSL